MQISFIDTSRKEQELEAHDPGIFPTLLSSANIYLCSGPDRLMPVDSSIKDHLPVLSTLKTIRYVLGLPKKVTPLKATSQKGLSLPPGRKRCQEPFIEPGSWPARGARKGS